MAKCRECGKEIRWIKTTAGKAMPVDPKPVLYWVVPGGAARIVTPEGKVLSCVLQGATKDVAQESKKETSRRDAGELILRM